MSTCQRQWHGSGYDGFELDGLIMIDGCDVDIHLLVRWLATCNCVFCPRVTTLGDCVFCIASCCYEEKIIEVPEVEIREVVRKAGGWVVQIVWLGSGVGSSQFRSEKKFLTELHRYNSFLTSWDLFIL